MARVAFWTAVIVGWIGYAYALVIFSTPEQRRAVARFIAAVVQAME
jgi:hypothetical protein